MTKLSVQLALVSAAILATLQPVAAQLSLKDARCRQALAVGVQRFVGRTLTAQRRCHRDRMLGRLPLADCNDLQLSGGVDSAAIAERATRYCAAASTPATLGLGSCPDPCEDVQITSHAGVGSCMACFSQAEISASLTTAYGALPAPPIDAAADVRRCQNSVGSALQRELRSWLVAQRHCQYSQDLNPAFAGDCRNQVSPPVGRAIAQGNRLIERCDDAALGSLSTCAGNVAGEALCIAETATSRAGRLYDLVYNQAGLATSTPTPEPTVTDTPVPSPSPTLSPTPTESPTNTPITPLATRTPSCAPTGTPYCSVACQPCPTIRPDCYKNACGACIEILPCQNAGEVHHNCQTSILSNPLCQCACVTPTPTPTSGM